MMRLSSFIKSTEDFVVVEKAKEVEIKKKPSEKDSSASASEGVPSPPDVSVSDPKILEEEVQRRLEEFHRKAERIEEATQKQEATKKQIEEVLERERACIQQREKRLEEEWQKLHEKVQKIELEKGQLADSVKENLTMELSQRLESIRHQLSRDIQEGGKQDFETFQRVIQEIQETLKRQEIEISSWRRLSSDMAQPLKSEKAGGLTSPEKSEQKQEEMTAEDQKGEQVTKESEAEADVQDQPDQIDKSTAGKELISKPPDTGEPEIRHEQDRRDGSEIPEEAGTDRAASEAISFPPKPFEPEKVTVESIISFDPAVQEEVKKIYEELIYVVDQVFACVARSEKLDFTRLNKPLRKLLAIAAERDAEILYKALEPYPTENYFSHHAVNCAFLAVVLGFDLSLSNEKLEELAFATLFHDIGLVSVCEDLSYPDQLTKDMKEEVLNHPLKGEEILSPYVGESILMAVKNHHEVCNGQGYPAGRQSGDIPFDAKIIHLVDTFEALTHVRPYRKTPLPVSGAIKEIIEIGRTIYDTQVLKALMRRIGLYPVMSLVELSNKQIGRVVKQNPDYPVSPIVKIEFDEKGHKLEKPVLISLSESRVIHIVGIVKDIASYHTTRLLTSKKKKKLKQSDFLKRMIPLALILSALAVLLYILIKI